MYATPIRHLLEAFSRLPGVGPRTAERYIFHLLKSGKREATEIADTLRQLVETVRSCEVCWDFSDQSPCAICADTTRDAGILAVVAEPADLHALEAAGAYRGRYHVLRGTLDALDEESIARLKIQELMRRVAGGAREIILALNPDVRGETTALYLKNAIAESFPQIAVAVLARGLPMGADLRYADEITLANAVRNRTPCAKN